MLATPRRDAAKQDLSKTLNSLSHSSEMCFSLYGSSCKATTGNGEAAYYAPHRNMTRMTEDWFSKHL